MSEYVYEDNTQNDKDTYIKKGISVAGPEIN